MGTICSFDNARHDDCTNKTSNCYQKCSSPILYQSAVPSAPIFIPANSNNLLSPHSTNGYQTKNKEQLTILNSEKLIFGAVAPGPYIIPYNLYNYDIRHNHHTYCGL